MLTPRSRLLAARTESPPRLSNGNYVRWVLGCLVLLLQISCSSVADDDSGVTPDKDVSQSQDVTDKDINQTDVGDTATISDADGEGTDVIDVSDAQCTSDDDCDDDNQCTEDLCAFGGDCKHIAVNGVCNDGNPCTIGDVCVGVSCTGDELECDDDNSCTTDGCSASAGSCVYVNNVLSCIDGNPCTLMDSCAGGNCQPGAGKECDDSNPCTDDACNQETGACVHLDNSDPCEDGDGCTLNDVCIGGDCISGVPVACDDSDECTSDSCNSDTGFCAYTMTGGSCDDDNPCTADDTCIGGTCTGTGGVDCSDDNPCTDDLCDAVIGGCINLFNESPCDDGDACTEGDACASSLCLAGTAKNCDDLNPCTDDSCVGRSGDCVFAPNTEDCDDGDPCTQDSQCQNSQCQGGDTIDCDDGNGCTSNDCNSATGGCQSTVAVGVECDDANECTENDTCTANGGCAGLVAECNDGDECTTGEICAAGECQGGTPTQCDDGNQCTDDSCDSVTGQCEFDAVFDLTACDPPSACETGQCIEGICIISNTSEACDDGDVCTDDRCSENGCIFPATVCGDGSACLSGVCDSDAGGCAIQTSDIQCDDGIECSLDSCSVESGCMTSYPAGCCDAKALIAEFDSGQLPSGWTIQNTGVFSGWQVVSGKNATTGTGSLYYGNPALWNYDNDGVKNAGTVETRTFVVPNTPNPILRFRLWRDIEGFSGYDSLRLVLASDDTKLWDKSSQPIDNAWHNVLISLADHAGETISVRWEFDTFDTANNKTTGVFIDSVRVLGCQ